MSPHKPIWIFSCEMGECKSKLYLDQGYTSYMPHTPMSPGYKWKSLLSPPGLQHCCKVRLIFMLCMPTLLIPEHEQICFSSTRIEVGFPDTKTSRHGHRSTQLLKSLNVQLPTNRHRNNPAHLPYKSHPYILHLFV